MSALLKNGTYFKGVIFNKFKRGRCTGLFFVRVQCTIVRNSVSVKLIGGSVMLLIKLSCALVSLVMPSHADIVISH